MRVLAISYEDPADILGGMGMHVRELYREMASMGHRIDVLTNGAGEGAVPYLGFTKHHDDKHVCHKPRTADFACRLLIDIQMAKSLMALIAERGCDWDVIHLHEWTAVQVGRMARRALKLPLVSTMHLCMTHLNLQAPGSDPGDWGEGDRYMVQQEGNLVCDPDRFVVCSHAYKTIVRQQFMTERAIDVVHNGINLDEWHPGSGDPVRGRTLFRSNGMDRPVALFVGRIADMKGIIPILDAVEHVDTGWQVVLVGEVNANTETDKEDWIVTKRIREDCKVYPERLQWLGFKHGQDLRDLYELADVVLMPSTHEPFGLVALEAMAMGTPLIATDVDGLGEIVTDDAGREFALIIPPDDPHAIVSALTYARSYSTQSELRDLGLQRAADFGWQTAVNRTLAVYEHAMAVASPRIAQEQVCTSY